MKGGQKKNKMTTKTIMFGIIAMLALAMFATTMVMAENNTLVNTQDTSSVNDVSSSTILWKEVGLWFTFNQEKKMNKEMDLAQLRLQQAEYATAHNNTDAAEKAMNAYQNLVDSANKRNEILQAGGTASANMVRLAAMDQAILAHQDRIAKISALLTNSNLTDAQRTKLEARLSQVENVTTHLQDTQAAKEDKIKTRLMAEGNLTEEQAQTMMDNAKENASEITGGARAAWQNFKEQAKANNMTPAEFAKQRRQDFRNEVRNETRIQKPTNQSSD